MVAEWLTQGLQSLQSQVQSLDSYFFWVKNRNAGLTVSSLHDCWQWYISVVVITVPWNMDACRIALAKDSVRTVLLITRLQAYEAKKLGISNIL